MQGFRYSSTMLVRGDLRFLEDSYTQRRRNDAMQCKAKRKMELAVTSSSFNDGAKEKEMLICTGRTFRTPMLRLRLMESIVSSVSFGHRSPKCSMRHLVPSKHFEINKLRKQLQGKDDTIRNLDAQISIMKVLNVGSTEGGLKIENVSLKRWYDELSKAHTHSRTAYTEKLSALTSENTKLKAQVTSKTSSGPSTSETPKVLAWMVKNPTSGASKIVPKRAPRNHSSLPAKSANARRVEAHHRTLNKKNRVDSNLLVKHSVSVSNLNNVYGACSKNVLWYLDSDAQEYDRLFNEVHGYGIVAVESSEFRDLNEWLEMILLKADIGFIFVGYELHKKGTEFTTKDAQDSGNSSFTFDELTKTFEEQSSVSGERISFRKLGIDFEGIFAWLLDMKRSDSSIDHAAS
ncbi:hypothetical protein Tco_0570940 [Tanacetum coccineum]